MKLLATFEHFDKKGYTFSTGFELLRSLYAPENGIAVAAFEGCEEGFCSLILIQRNLQIRRNSSISGGIIGLLPASVLFCTFHLSQASGPHSAAFYEH